MDEFSEKQIRVGDVVRFSFRMTSKGRLSGKKGLWQVDKINDVMADLHKLGAFGEKVDTGSSHSASLMNLERVNP